MIGQRRARRTLGAGPRARLAAAVAALAATLPAGALAAGCTLTAVELPVHVVGQSVIATVGINGHDVPMTVDTGAWFSSMPDATAEQLKLSPHHVAGFKMYGIVGKTDARIVSTTLTLAKGNVPNVEFIVGGNDNTGSRGLIGRNILAHTDTEYDLAHGVIRFIYPGDGCGSANMAYWAGNAPVSVLALSNTDPSPTAAFIATVKVNGVAVDALFDTGARTMVSLAAARKAGVQEADMKRAAPVVGIARGTVPSWTAPIARVEIGAEAISNNRLWVTDFDLRDIDMLVGVDFFLSHRVLVSRRQSRMYFTYEGGTVFANNVAEAAGGAASAPAGAPAEDGLSADALGRRGQASLARGNTQAALADLDRAVALEPGNAQLHDIRGSVLHRMEQWDKAAEEFDAALKIDPDLVHARLGRAYIREFRKDRAGALADLDLADKALPPQAPFRVEMGASYISLGEPARGLAQYDLWIASHPHDQGLPRVLNRRCWQRVVLNQDLDKALADCDQAIAIDPDDALALDSRAWLWLRQRLWQKARAEFDRSLAKKADGYSSLYGRGIARLNLGDKAGGEADLAAARKLRPEVDARYERDGLSAAQLAPHE